MAASMVSTNSVSKRTFKYIILGNILSAIVIVCLLYIPFGGNSHIDIVHNPLSATKLLSACSLFLHGSLHLFLFFTNKGHSLQKFRLGQLVKDILRSVGIFVLCTIFFHCIAVLFGAAFTIQTAETFHFAMMLASTTVGPLLIHLELNADTWVRVLVFQSPEIGLETTVYISSICSLIGAWIGAFPIPLDWDRPWQVWPITCVVGAISGHCIGILLASVYISLQFYRSNKFKLT